MQDKIVDFLEKYNHEQNELWMTARKYSKSFLEALGCSKSDLEMLADADAKITVPTSFGKVILEITNVCGIHYGSTWQNLLMVSKVIENEKFTGKVKINQTGGGTIQLMVLADTSFQAEVFSRLKDGEFEIVQKK